MDARTHLDALQCFSLEMHQSTEEVIEAFCVWVGALMKRAGLIDNASVGEIHQGPHPFNARSRHLCIKEYLPSHSEPPGLGKWGCPLQVAAVRGLGGGPNPTLRRHVCPVPDKTLKHAWDVYSTIVNSTYLTPHAPLCTRLHVCCHTCQRFCEENKDTSLKSLQKVLPQTKNWHFMPFCCVSDLCKYHRLNL